ncbi:La-related protein 6 [Hordeum vulgare]|nr:La-related protein 6 [Hordeum vulgare]
MPPSLVLRPPYSNFPAADAFELLPYLVQHHLHPPLLSGARGAYEQKEVYFALSAACSRGGRIRADPLIPEEHLAAEVGEGANYVDMQKASSLRAHVFLYLRTTGYDSKLVKINGFTRAMSQFKWSTDNASGSTAIDLFKGHVADLLHLSILDL